MPMVPMPIMPIINNANANADANAAGYNAANANNANTNMRTTSHSDIKATGAEK